MESLAVSMFLVSFLNIWGTFSTEGGKVFTALLDKASTVSSKSPLRIEENTITNSERMVKDHDNFLVSLFTGTEHAKLYSYTHLLNGFAIHVTSDEVCYLISRCGFDSEHYPIQPYDYRNMGILFNFSLAIKTSILFSISVVGNEDLFMNIA